MPYLIIFLSYRCVPLRWYCTARVVGAGAGECFSVAWETELELWDVLVTG